MLSKSFFLCPLLSVSCFSGYFQRQVFLLPVSLLPVLKLRVIQILLLFLNSVQYKSTWWLEGDWGIPSPWNLILNTSIAKYSVWTGPRLLLKVPHCGGLCMLNYGLYYYCCSFCSNHIQFKEHTWSHQSILSVECTLLSYHLRFPQNYIYILKKKYWLEEW